MNRRRFIQSLAALFSVPAISPAIPALSFPGTTAAVAVPTKARFWAIYMSALQGQVTPQTLQAALNIPALEAKSYITQLVADGVIKPNPMLKSAISNVVKEKKDNLLERIKDRYEMKSNARVSQTDLENDLEAIDEQIDQFDDSHELLEEVALDEGADKQAENETNSDETIIQIS